MELLNKIVDKAFPKDTVFDQILAVTLSFEGQYKPPNRSDVEPTNYGITQSTYSLYNRSKELVPKHVLYIKPNEVKAIYYEMYYLRSNINLLPEPTRGVVFDFYVNSPKNAVIQLQKLVHTFPDGRIGNDTANATQLYIDMRNHGLKTFVTAYSQARKDFYYRLVKEKPEKKENLKGWLNRTSAIEKIYGK